MGERRVLVIGSQCEELGHLDFLPKAAEELYAVMTDPERGACKPALEAGGLFIDPTVAQAKEAIKTAYKRAAKDGATLFIAYVGHGESPKKSLDLFLMPKDAKIPPESDVALHLTQIIKEAHTNAPGEIDGLGVLVDACYAGKAGFAAAKDWVAELEGTLRFDMLTATAVRPAANGCFSLTLAKLLREGVGSEPSEHLLSLYLEPLIKASCENQVPQHLSWNVDRGLWLSRNTGGILLEPWTQIEPWAQTALADDIKGLTEDYQPTPALDEIVERFHKERCLALVGEAGQSGDFNEGLRLSQISLPDLERVLGADDRDTLTTRNNIAAFTGQGGDFKEGLRLSQILLPDLERVLGADHPTTLTTRNNIALFTGQSGDFKEGLRLSQILLPDLERVLGADHPTTLTTRNNIAAFTGLGGDFKEGLRLSTAVLPDLERVLGAEHPTTAALFMLFSPLAPRRANR